MKNEYKERAQKVLNVLKNILVVLIKVCAPFIVLGLLYIMTATNALMFIFRTLTWITENPLLATVIALLVVIVISLIYIFIPPLLKKKKITLGKKASTSDNDIVKTASKRSVENYKERSLLTETENRFYRYLMNELKDYDVTIHPKVRLEDLVSVRAETRKEYMQARGYVKSRHIDFILCDRDMALICGIEVDDASHQDPHAKEIDEFKNSIFRKFGKELYRVVKMDKLEEGAHIIVENLVQRNLIQKRV